MKTILATTAAFLIAGATGGYAYEALALRHTHAQGFVLPLTDFTFEIISIAIFGVIGCLVGLTLGLAYSWLRGRSKSRSADY